MIGDRRVSDAALIDEIERALYDYSFAWEGEREEVRDLGDALLRLLPQTWFGLGGFAVRLLLSPNDPDTRIEAIKDALRDASGPVVWVVGPSSTPADLGERLQAHGLVQRTQWDGLVLDDLSADIGGFEGVSIEPLQEENLEEYVAAGCEMTHDQNHAVAEERRAAGRRYLKSGDGRTLLFLARLEGQPAGAVVLRLEPNGIAVLRNAFTLPQFQRRGVYLAGVARRLQVAREAGCTVAVVQAINNTSSPILQKRGFRKLCELYAYAPGDQPAAMPEQVSQ